MRGGIPYNIHYIGENREIARLSLDCKSNIKLDLRS